MSTLHRDLADSELHEPKGIATAVNKTLYVAGGTGSGSWRKQASGFIYFENTTSPGYALAAPGAGVFAKLAPTTIAAALGSDFTEATTARLTYTGTITSNFAVQVNTTISHDTTGTRLITFAIYKNGVKVPGSLIQHSIVAGERESLAINVVTSMATNDYVELYLAATDAAVGFNTFAYSMEALPVGF